MSVSPLNLETIKLHLIENPQFTVKTADSLSSKEAIQYLIKALDHADKEFSQDIEDFLTRMGTETVPFLLEGLLSDSNHVKSTCAMVLIRLGQSVMPALQAFGDTNNGLSWVTDFILEQLGQRTSKPALLALVG